MNKPVKISFDDNEADEGNLVQKNEILPTSIVNNLNWVNNLVTKLQEQWNQNIDVVYTPTCLIPLSSIWDDNRQQEVINAIATFDIKNLKTEEIRKLWLNEEKQLMNKLLLILDKIGIAKSPILYEIADLLVSWVDWINFKKIEAKINKANNPSKTNELINWVKRVSNSEALLELVNDIDREIRPQAQKLSENIKKIEKDYESKIEETLKANDILIEAWSQILSEAPIIASLAHFTYGITERAKIQLLILEEKYDETRDVQDKHNFEIYRDVVKVLESRAIALETRYHRIEPSLGTISDIISYNNSSVAEWSNTFYNELQDLITDMIQYIWTWSGLQFEAWIQHFKEVKNKLHEKNKTNINRLSTESINASWKNRLNEAEALLDLYKEKRDRAIKQKEAYKVRDEKFTKAQSIIKAIIDWDLDIVVEEEK